VAALTDITNIEFKIGNVAQTPVLDLHSSGIANLYDVRLIGSGGTSTNGQGTLNILAANLNWNGSGLALLAAPSFTGIPRAPTANAYSNTTQIATTAYVATAAHTPVTTVAASGTAQALAFAINGNNAYDITLSGNCNYTLTGGNVGQFQICTLIERQPASGPVYTGTLPAGVKYPYGSIPASNQNGQIRVVQFATPDAGVTVIGGF
jgi:hypothetical protein